MLPAGACPVRTVSWTINDGTNSYSATSTIDVDRAPLAVNNTATDAVGTTLSTTAASRVLSNASDLDGDSLTVTGVSDTAHRCWCRGIRILPARMVTLTLNADGSYSYIADNTLQRSAQRSDRQLPSARHVLPIRWSAMQATAAQQSHRLCDHTFDRATVVTAPNVTFSAGQTTIAAASSLFSGH